MNNCVICGKECKGECCSGACRARKSRRTRTQGITHTERLYKQAKQGSTRAGSTEEVVPMPAMPKGITQSKAVMPRASNPDVQRIWDSRRAAGQPTIYSKPYLITEPVKPSLPGDPDYDGVCLDPKYDSHRRANYV